MYIIYVLYIYYGIHVSLSIYIHRADGRKIGQSDGRAGGTVGRVDGRSNGRMVGWVGGLTDRWTVGRMDGRGWMLFGGRTVARPMTDGRIRAAPS